MNRNPDPAGVCCGAAMFVLGYLVGAILLELLLWPPRRMASWHGLACHNRSQELRAQIDAADNGPALSATANAIATGWPEGSS